VLNINIADSPIRNIKNVLEGGLVLQKMAISEINWRYRR